MKRFKGLLVFVLLFVSTIMISNTKCLAEEVQYTDNVIPAMISDTAPSGVASASSIYNSSYIAFKAFDHDTSNVFNSWITKSGIKSGWLEYDFEDARCITKYTITSRNSSSFLVDSPRDWSFEAWDEELQEWVVLDTQNNITYWERLVKKEFTFTNTSFFNKYRINITANNNSSYTVIGELEMMETVKPQVSAPTNLTATVEKFNVNLSWDAVDGATSYNIKRSTISGGPYETITTGSAITFTDTDVTLGTTYYYVVSAVIFDTESTDSNEASATIELVPVDNILKVVLEVGEQLQLSVDDDLDVNTEMTWSSSDNTVAAVDGYGVVTALAPGNTVITVTSEDGTYTDYINVLVIENADDYRLAIDLKVGKSCGLTVNDLTDTVNVTWDSMDSSVATVSSNGRVTAVSKGLALVTATDEEGNIIGQVCVRVKE
ncbi:MAG: Ig-like domain-containing protein [Anaerocolumna sp.]